MRRSLGVLSCALALCTAPLSAQRAERPPLEAGRLTGEVVGGAYAGIAGFLAGRWIGNTVADAIGVEHDKTRNAIALSGAIAGAGLGTAGAVYAIGSLGDQSGDFSATMLGGGVGWVAGTALSRVLFGDTKDATHLRSRTKWVAATVEALLPSIGATIGFNSTRRRQ